MRTIVITGAGGGLGQEVIPFFLEKGYRVIAIVRRPAPVLKAHPHLQIELLDLLDEKAVADFVVRITANETLHAALLLAGGFAMGSLQDTGIEDIHRQLALNFETAYPLARNLFPYFIEKGFGRLVLIGSRPAIKPEAGAGSMVAYTLAKSLIFQLATLLNETAKDHDVTATVIVPSTIDTPVNRQSMPHADFSKWVQPQQIAAAMHFICSEEGNGLREPVFKLYGES